MAVIATKAESEETPAGNIDNKMLTVSKSCKSHKSHQIKPMQIKPPEYI